VSHCLHPQQQMEESSLSTTPPSAGDSSVNEYVNLINTRKWDPILEKAVVEATRTKNISEIEKLLENRDDQKLYGALVAEVAAENGHIEVFDLLRAYGIIDVGNALERAG
jgi:hypothetical protein